MGLVLFWTVDGLTETFAVTDFEVFQMAGRLALERDPGLYVTDSPVKERAYFYPPGAAILLIPVGAAPNALAIVLWTLAKAAALAGVALLCARLSGLRLSPSQTALAASLGMIFVLRPLNSDFGNGQINLLVLVFGVFGVVWMMRSDAVRWAGVVLLAMGVVGKLTPALLLAVLFLQRRWAVLAAGVVACGLLLFALPLAWFGPERMAPMMEDYRNADAGLWREAFQTDDLTSLYELVTFTVAQWSADPGHYVFDDGILYEPDGVGELSRVRLDPGLWEKYLKPLWLLLGLGVGAAFLIVRWRLFRGREFDWRWDLVVLAALIPLLSPLVRRAYLVAFLPAACWAAAHLIERIRASGGGWRYWPRALRIDGALFFAAALMILAADDIYLPIPGFPMPLHFANLVGCLLLLVLLARLAPLAPGTEKPPA